MPQRIKTEFGIEGNLKEVEFEIPDGEPMPWSPKDQLSVVGQPIPRLDAHAKVTGQAKYTYDIQRPGMLHGRILRSPHPAALIKKIDTSRAEALAGVKAVEVAPIKKVLFAGQEVAAVAAVNQKIAEDAIRLIEVEYEIKPFVTTIEQAMKPDAPTVHEISVNEKASEGELPGERQQTAVKGNVRGPQKRGSGDVEKGFAEADAIFEATFHTQVQTHSALETHGVVAEWQGEKLTVWASTQGTFSVRDELASVFKIPSSNVRVITEFMGGGFGAKFGAGVYGVMAAKLAKKTGLAVKLMLDRKEEHLAAGNRPNSVQKIKIGAKKDGKLTAMQLVSHGSGGIGGGAGTAGPFLNLYSACPNRSAEESDVFINAGPAAAMRAPGHPQGAFALESAIDMVAEKIGIDPLLLRKMNDPDPVRLAEIEQGATRIGWERRNRVAGSGSGTLKRGIGMANSVWYNTGRPGAQVQIKIHSDGTVELFNGAQDIGSGIRTVIAQIAAEELGLSVNDIKIRFGDTEYPFGPASGGSTTTPSLTPAVRAAAIAGKKRMFDIASEMLKASAQDLDMRDGRIFVKADPSRNLTFKAVAAKIPGDTLTVQGERARNYEAFKNTVAGVQFAEVEVDTKTGQVRVLKIVAVHDCGRPMNRLTLRSQINGGIIQGLSYALFEDRLLDPKSGRMLNPNFEKYKVAGALDMPLIETHIIDVYNGSNNTGTVGIGEPATVPTAAAIANAVYNAIGARVYELPITPARVLEAIEKSKETRR